MAAVCLPDPAPGELPQNRLNIETRRGFWPHRNLLAISGDEIAMTAPEDCSVVPGLPEQAIPFLWYFSKICQYRQLFGPEETKVRGGWAPHEGSRFRRGAFAGKAVSVRAAFVGAKAGGG
jgi:hypothetical protein